jgi:hypothetical protein
MPQKSFSTSIATGAINANVLSGWQYEYLPWPARLKLLLRTPNPTTAGALHQATIFSGSETIQEESPVQAGGTAGVTPSELNTPPIVWDAPAGDRIKVQVRSTDSAALTVDGIIYAYPLI